MTPLDLEISSDEEYFPTAEDLDDLDDLMMDEEDEEEDENEEDEEGEGLYEGLYEEEEDETEEEEPAMDVERLLLQSHPNLLRQIQQVLQHGISSRTAHATDSSPPLSSGQRIRRRLQEIPPTPFPEGKRLLNSGEFGVIDDRTHKRRRFEDARTVTQFARFRELGAGMKGRSMIGITKQWLPGETSGRIVTRYDCHVYSGQFSHDGGFFYTASQDFRCRMYSTPNPANPQDWRLYKGPSPSSHR